MTHYEIRDQVAFITLNRPEKRNALSPELVDALHAHFDAAAKDSNVRVVILRSSGTTFCAGADLAYLQRLQHFSREENSADAQHLMRLFLRIHELPKPVIAQVEGHALAGGAGLAIVCDFVYAAPEAYFGFTEVRIGFVPAIVSVFLQRIVGDRQARQLLLTGQMIQATEALQMGLITRIVPAAELQKATIELAQLLRQRCAPNAVRSTKHLLAINPNQSLHTALQQAVDINTSARESVECRRGIAAFLDRQAIHWADNSQSDTGDQC